MNFNLVGSLLAVSSGSGRGTVHVFKLGAHGSSQNSPRLENGNSPHSPPESVDGTTPGLEGGYEAFVEKKKSGGGGVRCVSLLFYVFFFPWLVFKPASCFHDKRSMPVPNLSKLAFYFILHFIFCFRSKTSQKDVDPTNMFSSFSPAHLSAGNLFKYPNPSHTAWAGTYPIP